MPHPSHTPPSLELRGLSAGYSTRRAPVLDAVSVVVGPVGTVRVGGANGAGKSTLIEVASGYLRPFAGSVRVAGAAATSRHARQVRRVCRTVPALYPQLSVAEHLDLAGTARGVDVAEGRRRAAAYGLDPWLDREAQELSTGNARKLWFLVCTLGPFAVALLDEPFNGLDEEARATMCDEIERWSRTRSVVVVAHEVPVGLRVDDEVVLQRPERSQEGSVGGETLGSTMPS